MSELRRNIENSKHVPIEDLPDLDWGKRSSKNERWEKLRNNLNESRSLRQRPIFPDEEIPIRSRPSIREKKRGSVQIWMRLGIFAAAVSTMVSGFYLYDQGSKVWFAAKPNLFTPEVKSDPKELTVVREIPVIKTEVKIEKAIEKLVVRTGGAEEIPFYSGPGTEFPVIGKARSGQTLSVIDWKEQWFRVGLLTKGSRGETTGWIQNDWVEAQGPAPTSNGGVTVQSQ